MKVYVDADACPVKQEIIKLCRKRDIPVVMVCDTSHQIEDGYSEVVVVDQGQDSADIHLINRVSPGDIVVTQDYGVAAMALGKKAIAIDQNGREYTAENIEPLLFDRYLGAKERKRGRVSSKNKKRTPADDRRFFEAFELLLNKYNL